jgi:hypothetical protein
LLKACCCVAKHVLRLLWRLPDPITGTYRKILLHPAVDRGLWHQIPHAKHEERLKPPDQIFTRAARGWKKDPCRRCIISRYLVPTKGVWILDPLIICTPNSSTEILSYLMSMKIFSAQAFAFSAGLATNPTTLYRFEKKVIQSSSVCFSLSSRSSHSGFTSSAFVLVRARARDASWPANTVQTSMISIFLEEDRIVDSHARRKGSLPW